MIVTRFAPSPTGYLHIGGLRTALYSYLYAKANNGKFILRIEDTDLKRNSQEAAQAIKQAFKWCNMQYDGKIEYQSQRFDIYKKYIQKLLDEKKAYKCYMSQQELSELRKDCELKGLRPKYDGRYRDYEGEIPQGIEPVIRIKAPLQGDIEFIDGIKGSIKFNCQDILDDFIIARSDGSPTYNFVVVVDDALMGVTDIIRGDDHLSNTPKQIVLYNALGFCLPNFYHVAMINGSDGSKLSKRHGATDVMEYKKMGYLPQALLNFLVRLGWSNGDDEIFSIQELIENFNPKNISKSSSTYNASKLEWLNHHYIKTLPYEELNEQIKFFGLNFDEIKNGKELLDILRQRSKTLIQIVDSANSIIKEPEIYEKKSYDKFINDNSLKILSNFSDELKDNLSNYEEFTNEFLDKNSLNIKDLAPSLRIALTGSNVSPSIFDVMRVLGNEEIKKRIKKILKGHKNE